VLSTPRTSASLILLLLAFSPRPSLAAPYAIPLSGASAVFATAHALCEADGGRLWGISLCGPLLLADPQTHQAIANTPVEGATRDGAFYRFTLPPDFAIANSPTEYGGVRWAMIMWPPPENSEQRDVMLMHESFHRIQPQLGFNGDADISIAGVPSLDTEAARIWLRGELNALRVALTSTGDARKAALSDALAMRAYRHALFPRTAQDERYLDVLEGLAESTGIDVGLAPEQRISYAIYDIDFVESVPSYSRAFPYGTGPAYSLLLDAVDPSWRRRVTPSTDLAVLAASAYGISLATPTATQAEAIIARYGGATIEREEAARAVAKAALDRTYHTEFVSGPTLQLPMTHFTINFNPSEVEQFESFGSVYHKLVLVTPWGKITVSGGDALISTDFKTLTVVAPSSPVGTTLHGNSWTLQLAAGAKVVPDPKRPGSYIIVPP
jgi:hypothetical protein